jgi:hypothetical protein
MSNENGERPVMLSLISEQAIPNVMAALLVKPRPRAMVCLLPEDKERKGQVDREFVHVFSGIHDALARIDENIQVLNWASPEGGGRAISPYDAREVMGACRAVRADPQFAGAAWIYNFTGGTKVMAQAAVDDARSNGCQALYVDTESRQLIWDQGDAVDFDEDRLRGVGVAEYLAAYGVQVRRHRDSLAEDLCEAARLLGRDAAGPSLVDKVKGSEVPSRDDKVVRRFGPDDLTGPERELLLDIADALRKRDIGVRRINGGIELVVWTTDEDLRSFFWGGRWLESYTFDIVRQLSQRAALWQYNMPRRNILVEWAGIEYSGLQEQVPNDLVRPANELDVAATRGARLLVCECKTGRYALKPRHLYKLQVIGHKLGTFADKVLVTDRSDLLNRQNRSVRNQVVRALTLNIAVVQASQLPALDEVLDDLDRELRRQKRRFEIVA